MTFPCRTSKHPLWPFKLLEGEYNIRHARVARKRKFSCIWQLSGPDCHRQRLTDIEIGLGDRLYKRNGERGAPDGRCDSRCDVRRNSEEFATAFDHNADEHTDSKELRQRCLARSVFLTTYSDAEYARCRNDSVVRIDKRISDTPGSNLTGNYPNSRRPRASHIPHLPDPQRLLCRTISHAFACPRARRQEY